MSNETMWRRRVEEWKSSGQPSTTFTEGREYSSSALRYWAKRLEKNAAAPVSPPMRIARLVRDGAPSADGEAPISIGIGGVRVTVGSGFDRAALRAVLEVLAELGTTTR